MVDDVPVPVPPHAPAERLTSCIQEVKRLIEEERLKEEKRWKELERRFEECCGEASPCLGKAMASEDEDLSDEEVSMMACRLPSAPPQFDAMRVRRKMRHPSRRMASFVPAFTVARPRPEPPNLHAAVLSFSARLLTYVNEKCDGFAPMAYKRAGISRQTYSRLVSRDDSPVDKRTTMQFCIGLQLEMPEAELLMKSAGYAFSGTLPEDRVFTWCIENKTWNLEDINTILVECHLRPITEK